MESRELIDASTAQLRMRTNAYSRRFAMRVEATADEIREGTDDPTARRNALEWKLYAIPVIYESALQPDPFLALADTWAYARQLEIHYETGLGRDAFGSLQSLALEACREMYLEGLEIVRASVHEGDTSAALQQLDGWVADHPIRTRTLQRDRLSTVLAEGQLADAPNTFETVASIEQIAMDIDNRLGFFNESLLKQARWTAELAAEETVAREDVQAAMDTLLDAVRRLTNLAEAMPALIEAQRTALFVDVSDERRATFEAIDLQREAALAGIALEREAVFAGIGEEREALLAALLGEDGRTLSSAQELVENSLIDVVDHAFLRLSQLLGVAGVAGFVAFVLLRRILASSHEPPTRCRHDSIVDAERQVEGHGTASGSAMRPTPGHHVGTPQHAQRPPRPSARRAPFSRALLRGRLRPRGAPWRPPTREAP